MNQKAHCMKRFSKYVFENWNLAYTTPGKQLYFWDQWEGSPMKPCIIATRPRLLINCRLHFCFPFPWSKFRAELVQGYPGLRPERRSAVGSGIISTDWDPCLRIGRSANNKFTWRFQTKTENNFATVQGYCHRGECRTYDEQCNYLWFGGMYIWL